MMMRTLALASALILASAGAFAQTASKPTTPDQSGPGPASQGAIAAPPVNGVVHPPANVDPGMQAGTPAQSAFPTPVIHPPGTPGGNPNVIAK